MGQSNLSNLSDYKNSYIQTVREAMSSLQEQCCKLKDNVFDKEAINKIHIISHSLRGRSQIMGFESIANLSAGVEKFSNDILNRVGVADEKFVNFLKNFVDGLSLELSRIEKE